MHSGVPDIPWGNIPEPELRVLTARSSLPEIIFAENTGPAEAEPVKARAGFYRR